MHRLTHSSSPILAIRCALLAGLLGSALGPVQAQTSRMDNLTFAGPEFRGLQAAGADVEGCCQPSLSDDGRHVLFLSIARNLVAGDHNNNIDLFVRDRQLGTTRRVNLSSNGAQGRSGDAASGVAGAISANGDLVVFSSRQFDLVAGDTNLAADVFLHQLSTGITTRIVSGIGGAQADQGARSPSLSADGRFLVFESDSTNLAPGHLGGQHVYLLDRDSGAIERISVTPSGTASSVGSSNPTVSDDGRFVAFESSADDLVAEPGNGQEQLYVRDRQLGLTRRLSQFGGTPADSNVRNSMISGDGSRAVFETLAGNLDADDTNGVDDIYAVGVANGQLTRVSVSSVGAQSSQSSRRPSISRNGQRVAFASRGILATGGSEQFEQVYLRDLQLQSTTLVSVNDAGNNGNSSEFDARISGNGQVVAFAASSNDLAPGDTNGLIDRFARDLLSDSTQRINLADASGPFPSQANGDSTMTVEGQRQLSSDGRFLAIRSVAGNLGSNAAPAGTGQVYRIDAQNNLARLISLDINGQPAVSGAFEPSISADGRYVVFRSNTTNLVAGDTNNAADVFWLDTAVGGLERINLGPGDVQGLGGATTTLPTVSDDGNVIAFSSNQNNLVSGDTNSTIDIFVRDRVTASTARVSVDSAGAQANGVSGLPVLSADGRYIVFTSLASNLVANDSNGAQDVFRHDRQTGQTVRISLSSTGVQANSNSFGSALSADGSVVAFASAATNLVAGDVNARTDIFVRDVTLGATSVVSVNSSGELGNGTSSSPSISADGRFVTFLANSTNLVSGDTNGREDVFRHDRMTGQTLRLSVDPAGRQVSALSAATVTAGQISPDGTRVAIETTAADFELTLGVAGARSVMLATAASAPRPDDVFADGFE